MRAKEFKNVFQSIPGKKLIVKSCKNEHPGLRTSQKAEPGTVKEREKTL
jgi:hypothetical protein